MKVILVDIEGTITDISFVKQVLFPYASEHLETYVTTQLAQGNPQVEQVLQETQDLYQKDTGILNTKTTTELIEILLTWINHDKKATPLKSLQGMIWENGYFQKDFTGHLYEDAYQHLKQWKDQGLRLAVFSSGSEYAQKLLLSHSDYGDLTPWFEAYFDRRVGAKKEVKAYQNILSSLAMLDEAEEVLFLSDVVAELDAAKQAGMQTYELRRDHVQSSSEHPKAVNFSEIKF